MKTVSQRFARALAFLVAAMLAITGALFNYEASAWSASASTRVVGLGQKTGLGEWSWPVASPRVIVNPFRAPATPYSSGHRGIDLELSHGGEIFAPADGVVHFSGMVASRSVLSIAHSGELLSSYEAVSSELVAGDFVREGQTVGQLTDGGHCAGECLHFGVRLRGEYVSPLLLLGGVPRAVLLPLG